MLVEDEGQTRIKNTNNRAWCCLRCLTLGAVVV